MQPSRFEIKFSELFIGLLTVLIGSWLLGSGIARQMSSAMMHRNDQTGHFVGIFIVVGAMRFLRMFYEAEDGTFSIPQLALIASIGIVAGVLASMLSHIV